MVLADGELLTENDLPDRIREGTTDTGGTPRELPTGLKMEELERLAIQKALDQCGGNRTHAAGRLGISVRTLQRKLRQYERETGPMGDKLVDKSDPERRPDDILTEA